MPADPNNFWAVEVRQPARLNTGRSRRIPARSPSGSQAPLPQPPGFAHPHGGAGGVEVFQQRDGELAGGLGEVLELNDGDFFVFLEEIHQLGLEVDGLLVEIEVLLDLDQAALVHQHGEQLLDLVRGDLGRPAASLRVGGESWPRR